ncbi:hypothetical protein ABTY20_09685 [Streptomyces sp. NPDC126497]|uniref:hypothetical protein n=1 Tax=Streptomyces sp. NPDC126497 TaxID=3155313 RepID=UPI0033298F3C
MSGRDGYETAAHIKRRVRARDTPIIFVSAYEMGPHATFRRYAAGAVDRVSRPYDPWTLRARAATDLLAQLSTLLSDVETQPHDLIGQLQAQAPSATVRTTAARLERAVRSLRQALQDALDLQEEPGTPPAPASLYSPRHRDR